MIKINAPIIEVRITIKTSILLSITGNGNDNMNIPTTTPAVAPRKVNIILSSFDSIYILFLSDINSVLSIRIGAKKPKNALVSIEPLIIAALEATQQLITPVLPP